MDHPALLVFIFDMVFARLAAPLRSALKPRTALLTGRSIGVANFGEEQRLVCLAALGVFRHFSDVRFTESHEWTRIEGDTAVLGISNFAQDQLGEVVYVDLPSEGDAFKAKETIATLESVKAVGEVYSPANCEVIEVNEKLGEEPALVNKDSMGEGWLVKVKITGDLPEMMDSAAYQKHCEATQTEE